jgi:hypothetical protein
MITRACDATSEFHHPLHTDVRRTARAHAARNASRVVTVVREAEGVFHAFRDDRVASPQKRVARSVE